ncbi:MAG: hypothetical protein DMG65_25840 [Candidatus Angelobacter sp. Gp1-AA117]|nr:MAG: hypothetical protein DMG65_25840 [Candidatus Angelobacter sp. Gp1-AA117]
MPGHRFTQTKIFLLALLVTFSVAAAPSDTDRKGLEQRLRETFVGKGATLRNFYQENELEFDKEGHLLGQSKTGPWTYYGRIQVSSLKLTGDSLLMRGSRNVVQWEATAGEFNNFTLEDKPVRISIHLGPGYNEDSVLHAIDNVFLTRDTRLSDVVPSYWKEILTTERQRREEWDLAKAEAMKNVSMAAPELVPPKLLSKSEGIETSLSPFTEITANQLILSYVVDESGHVQQVNIEKPIGLGIDDPIADLISGWKYEPATKASHPVAVLMHARFIYKTPKGGRVDPYHTLPCPGIAGLFAC